VEAEKVEAVEEIRTNTLRTRAGAMAEYIELGRRGEAEGPLIAKSVLVRDRGRVEDVYAESVTLRRNCRARNIYAARIQIESDCRIGGEVKYTDSLRAEHNVMFGTEPEKTEKLPPPPF
jgi:cytoskeletal protein CcmA (bactofilin family)